MQRLTRTLKRIDDVLEVVVFDWALHPKRRTKTLLAAGAMVGGLALTAWRPAPEMAPAEAFARGTELLPLKAKAPESVRLLELASRGMAEDPAVWQNLGHAFLNAKREKDALSAYTRAVSLDPSTTHLFFLGYSYVKNDLPDVALGFYEQILAKAPYFYPAMAYQGVAHDKAGRYEEAKQEFQRALAYNPRYLPAHFHLGITYVNTKEYRQSIRAFKKVIALDPTESAAYYNIACCYSLMGEVDTANEWLRRSVEKGFHDYAHMDGDTDLDNIRESAEYQALREQARQAWEAEANTP